MLDENVRAGGLPAAEPAPGDVARSADLGARIGEEIARAGGRITFARFMEMCLYEPNLGYYRQVEDRPTDRGDFLTAPEAHPIFGWTLARQIEEAWRRLAARRPFTLVEYGAGSGTLGLSILDGLRRRRAALLDVIRYEPIELNGFRMAQLVRRFEEAGLADRLARRGSNAVPRETSATAAAPEVVVGCIVANEFLDALPVHRVTVRGGELCELFVTVASDGSFREEPAAPSTPALGEWLAAEGVRLAEGQVGEVCLAVEPWLDEVSARLARGYVLVIDYGYPADELYARRHFAGTLLAYRGHRVSDDPFAAVGLQDLTAHVDFSAVRRLAEARGFRSLGLVTQSEFLVGNGLADELRALQESADTSAADYTRARSAIVRMLDPRAMGRFRVLVLGRDVPRDPLSGLGPAGGSD